jgi:hypothetical protein
VKKILLFAPILLFFVTQSTFAQVEQLQINNFTVKENLLKNEKIAVIACDENDRPLETISGTFRFSINGFKQDLIFNGGIAVPPQPIDKSTFIYLRHTNDSGTHGKLYYVIKRDTDLKPIKISWLMLLLIPLGIIFLAMLFRKFLVIAIVMLAALLYFNSGKGLSIPTFFDTIFDGLRSIF